jgi:hypothetical protein
MSVTLVFNGGFFTVHPGAGRAKKVDVLMTNCKVLVKPEDTKVRISGAKRIDFLTNEGFNTSEIPIREIAHIIPVDYRHFKKVVSFNGGTVWPIPSRKVVKVSKKAVGPFASAALKAKLFKDTTGLDLKQGFYEQMLADEFHAQVSAGLHPRWVEGYRIAVELHTAELKIIVNGNCQKPIVVSEPNIEIQFNVSKKSTVPHFPDSNPHVLEQPPTI